MYIIHIILKLACVALGSLCSTFAFSCRWRANVNATQKKSSAFSRSRWIVLADGYYFLYLNYIYPRNMGANSRPTNNNNNRNAQTIFMEILLWINNNKNEATKKWISKKKNLHTWKKIFYSICIFLLHTHTHTIYYMYTLCTIEVRIDQWKAENERKTYKKVLCPQQLSSIKSNISTYILVY